MDYRAIVVGTDGSPAANETVRHGAALARSSGATLHIVTAYRRLDRRERSRAARDVPMNLDVDGAGDPYVAATAIVEDAAHDVRHRGVPIKLHVIPADPATAICDVAARVDAGVILIGNRGARNPFRHVNRPIFTRVQHEAPCEVRVVDTEHHRRPV